MVTELFLKVCSLTSWFSCSFPCCSIDCKYKYLPCANLHNIQKRFGNLQWFIAYKKKTSCSQAKNKQTKNCTSSSDLLKYPVILGFNVFKYFVKVPKLTWNKGFNLFNSFVKLKLGRSARLSQPPSCYKPCIFIARVSVYLSLLRHKFMLTCS